MRHDEVEVKRAEDPTSINGGLKQPIANPTKHSGYRLGDRSHTSEDVGKRYRRLLGQRSVLAHTRRVHEPPYIYLPQLSRL